MGGVLIKVGQFLSTRVDVLPPEFTNELAGLQDEVPAEKFEDIARVAEEEFGMPLQQKFAWIDPNPLAAASLGQVHLARLQKHDGEKNGHILDVVIKVQRPQIEQIIETDLAALETVGGWLNRYQPIRRRADVPALLREFATILTEEIDYLAEGRNAETFAVNFKENTLVKVPKVIWSHTTRRALTLENVLAIKISDYVAIVEAGINRAEVADRLLDTYLQQIFEDGFFHADPHPGNLFVSPIADGSAGRAKVEWQLTFIDFGMVAHVPTNTKEGLRELLIGVGTRDADRVLNAYQTLGVLLPSADLELIRRAEARVFDQFWGKNMSEMTRMDMMQVRQFIEEFRELIYSMPFQVPQDFIFLARCVGILSGMCTGLDPKFNVWDHLAPYAQKMISEETRANREVWIDEIRQYIRTLLATPIKLDAMLAKIERGEISVRVPEVSQQMRRIEAGMRQIIWAILFVGFFLGGIQVAMSGIGASGWFMIALSVLFLLSALFWRR
jgi:predicted unusual protein kinase regulating ubiquinone biosynthesis (AarF/ABC1/UbiB family)